MDHGNIMKSVDIYNIQIKGNVIPKILENMLFKKDADNEIWLDSEDDSITREGLVVGSTVVKPLRSKKKGWGSNPGSSTS